MKSSELLQGTESDRVEILKKYGRTPENVKQDIENVRRWLEKQPHLPEIPDDHLIEVFLRTCKFHIEQAKTKLDMYYSVRGVVPEFYEFMPSDPALKKIMDIMYFLPLPKLTSTLERLVVYKIRNPDLDGFDLTTFIAYTFMVIEVRLWEGCHISDVQIVDLSGARANFMVKCSPTVLAKCNFVIKNVFSNRLAGIHILCDSSFVDMFVTLLKTYFSPKVTARIFVHKNAESLLKSLPQELLPKDYGGGQDSLEELHEKWRLKLLEYEPRFRHLKSLKVNEKLRPGEPLTDDILGIGGNFRKLDVD